MQVETQFSIFLVNKPGVLAGVTGALAKARVNIVALTLMDSMEHGVLRIVTDSADQTREVLGKAHDRWTETEVILLELANEPGAFASVAQALANEHINISYAYCTGGAHGGRTTAVFKVADLKKGLRILEAARPKSKKDPRKLKRPPGRRPPA
jgi:hypothetical protein